MIKNKPDKVCQADLGQSLLALRDIAPTASSAFGFGFGGSLSPSVDILATRF